MVEILRNPSREEIIRVIDLSGVEFHQDVWLRFKAEKIDNQSYTLYTTKYSLNLLNGVINANFDEDAMEQHVSEIISFFEQKKVSFRWLLNRSTKPKNLLSYLQSRGFITMRNPGMAMNISNLMRKPFDIDGLEILRVANLDQAKDVAEVGESVYSIPESDFMNELELTMDNPNVNYYLALLNNKPIGISCVIYHLGIAGIYTVGVTDAARGKGIGSAITLAPLYDAQERGYEWSILTSSELGFNVYKRIGFEEYYKNEMAFWITRYHSMKS